MWIGLSRMEKPSSPLTSKNLQDMVRTAFYTKIGMYERIKMLAQAVSSVIQVQLLLFIKRKYAFICVKRQLIARRCIH